MGTVLFDSYDVIGTVPIVMFVKFSVIRNRPHCHAMRAVPNDSHCHRVTSAFILSSRQLPPTYS